MLHLSLLSFFFFFNDTATTEIYTLSLHDALPICIEKVEAWLAKPDLLEADKDAEYAAVFEIDLADIKEPIVCCPNDPDDAKFLSEVAGTKIDEAFIGSCMTNIEIGRAHV